MTEGFYVLDQKTQAIRGPFDSLCRAEDYLAQLEALISGSSGPRQAEEQAFKVVSIDSDEYAELKVRGTLLQAQLDLTAVWKKRAIEAEAKVALGTKKDHSLENLNDLIVKFQERAFKAENKLTDIRATLGK